MNNDTISKISSRLIEKRASARMHLKGFVDTCEKYGIEKSAAVRIYKEAGGGFWGWVGSQLNRLGRVAGKAKDVVRTSYQLEKGVAETLRAARKGTISMPAAQARFQALAERGMPFAESVANSRGFRGFAKRRLAGLGNAAGRIRGGGLEALRAGRFNYAAGQGAARAGGAAGGAASRGAGNAAGRSSSRASNMTVDVTPDANGVYSKARQQLRLSGPTTGSGAQAGTAGARTTVNPTETLSNAAAGGAAGEQARKWYQIWKASPFKAWGEWIGRHPKWGILSVATPTAALTHMADQNPVSEEASYVDTMTPEQKEFYNRLDSGMNLPGLGMYGGYF